PIVGGLLRRQIGTVYAVDGVDFDVHSGETFSLVGESGCGKTTLSRTVIKLTEPTAGTIVFNGRDITKFTRHQMREVRREMQIVFQDPYGAFNPRMTVGAIIGEALELRGIRSPQARASEVVRLLEMVQLPGTVRTRYPHEFSGGQRQRIGIARALAVEPRFLVADEPVSALDVSTQAEVVNLLLELQEQLHLTMLFISHDLSVVRVLSDRVAVMFSGKIVELAPTEALFRNPLHPYTQELLAAVPVPDPELAQREARERIEEGVRADLGPSASGCPYAGRCPHTMEICREQMPPLIDYSARLHETEPHWAACHWVEQQTPGGPAARTEPPAPA
ncbi:MAG TPA: ABC transporter ATP-binding protein, partial [Armatimonadota bacterium]|nr:ABC transporter ATP-binding protein [Armatimonadota bacterium]